VEEVLRLTFIEPERMTREQIAEAQRLFRERIEAHPPSGN
jgi:hypothetical protein